ncbi:MAG: hypothetical protein KJ066_22450 [Acidobacteria bacterium]|nr:hypothetical protein [Acidobacteriota bacterium]
MRRTSAGHLAVVVLVTLLAVGCAGRDAGHEAPAAGGAACELLTERDLTEVYGEGLERVPDSAPASWSGHEVATCVYRRAAPAPVVVVVSLQRVGPAERGARDALIAATREADPGRRLELVDDFVVPAVWDATLEQLAAFPPGAIVSIKPTEAGGQGRSEVARGLMRTAVARWQARGQP